MIPPEWSDFPGPRTDFEAVYGRLLVDVMAFERMTPTEQRWHLLGELAATEGLLAMFNCLSPAPGLSESAETQMKETIARGRRDAERMIRSYEVFLAEKFK